MPYHIHLIMKKQLVKLIAETGMILAVSLAAALGVNLFRDNGLPLNRAYIPPETTAAAPVANLPEIDMDTLKALMDGRMVVLLDARAAKMYHSGHIPGARNLPLGDQSAIYPDLNEILNSGNTIVTYCIDSECLDSSFLAQWLMARGHSDVMVFRPGMKGWLDAGNPVEISR